MTTGSRWILRGLLTLPAAVMLYRYITDAIAYGEFIHQSGDWSVWLLLATLVATPIRWMFPQAALSHWLLAVRRDLGVATFSYALLHTLVYLQRKADVALIVAEGIESGMATGWFALLLFVLLALTSNDASVRTLGPRWKSLHRLVYPAALLTFAHWLLLAFDITVALVHAGVLGAILAARFALQARRSRSASAPPLS
jgi:sulfoxide reductase heme-binding subunit YedZ